MRTSSLASGLTLALVAALLLISLIHLVTLDAPLAHSHREMGGPPVRDLGDGCCLFVCTSIIMGLLIATPALFPLRGRLSSSEPTTLAAILLPLDPPPRLASASHRIRVA